MPDGATYALFVAAALAFLVFPGPSVLYIVARSASEGRASGLASVLGVQSGTLVHILCATIGLSAVLAASATAFSVVKWLGVAYLLWLGAAEILARERDEAAPPVRSSARLRAVYLQGVLVNVLNPKTALFFLAFLPQFVDPAEAAWSQVLVLGVTLALIGTVTDGTYAFLGGSVGEYLRLRSAAFRRRQRYVTGGTYLALGAVAAAWRRTA